MNLPIPLNSTISSNFARISRRFMPRIAPFRYVFSRPVSSGWKPVPTSRMLPTRPRIEAVPSVGGVIRVRILRSVDLPEPFLPMKPTTSPSSTLNETSLSAQSSSSEWSTCSSRRARRAAWETVSRNVW